MHKDFVVLLVDTKNNETEMGWGPFTHEDAEKAVSALGITDGIITRRRHMLSIVPEHCIEHWEREFLMKPKSVEDLLVNPWCVAEENLHSVSSTTSLGRIQWLREQNKIDWRLSPE
jgi:hypothetical protein